MSAAAKKTAPTKTTTPATSGLPKEKLLSMYREMLTIRRFEEKRANCMAWASSVGSAISISGRKRW